jgi:hypothetical protein
MGSERGVVTDMSKAEVTLTVSGVKRQFPANEIQRITFEGEPSDLSQARTTILTTANYKAALEELKKIDLKKINMREELIKQEVAADKENIRKNSLGYFGITAIISVLWFASIPVWKPFMTHVLGFTDVDKLFGLVLLLVGFYVLYAVQNGFDSTFYGLGKTNYMLFESVVTNTIYYGIAFILYATNVWTPTLTGIALLFGIGNAFDSVVSLVAYAFLLRKEKINILKVE